MQSLNLNSALINNIKEQNTSHINTRSTSANLTTKDFAQLLQAQVSELEQPYNTTAAKSKSQFVDIKISNVPAATQSFQNGVLTYYLFKT